jgi:uncharacterized protein with gpF-like domain
MAVFQNWIKKSSEFNMNLAQINTLIFADSVKQDVIKEEVVDDFIPKRPEEVDEIDIEQTVDDEIEMLYHRKARDIVYMTNEARMLLSLASRIILSRRVNGKGIWEAS